VEEREMTDKTMIRAFTAGAAGIARDMKLRGEDAALFGRDGEKDCSYLVKFEEHEVLVLFAPDGTRIAGVDCEGLTLTTRT
jgi:hypothetical protein